MKIFPIIAVAVRCWRPVAPVVPPLLWVMGAAVGLAALNLVFEAEIWSAGAGKKGSWLALLGLLLLAGAQAVPVLWGWPPPPLAPRWGQHLWRLAISALAVALGLGLLAGAGVALVYLSILVDGMPPQD